MFYGDPHGSFDPIFEAYERHKPSDVIIVGDLELREPFQKQLAPLFNLGVRPWWIRGNHDVRNSPACWDLLAKDFPEGDLGGRVIEMGSSSGRMRVAGLGGVFRGKIWFPKEGSEAPLIYSRAELLKSGIPTFRGGVPIKHLDTIFPEDFEVLAGQRCDILVCHEAPSSEGEMGFGAIDDLAKRMGATLVVHGHHHRPGVGKTRDGIAVRSLGMAEIHVVS